MCLSVMDSGWREDTQFIDEAVVQLFFSFPPASGSASCTSGQQAGRVLMVVLMVIGGGGGLSDQIMPKSSCFDVSV